MKTKKELIRPNYDLQKSFLPVATHTVTKLTCAQVSLKFLHSVQSTGRDWQLAVLKNRYKIHLFLNSLKFVEREWSSLLVEYYIGRLIQN